MSLVMISYRRHPAFQSFPLILMVRSRTLVSVSNWLREIWTETQMPVKIGARGCSLISRIWILWVFFMHADTHAGASFTHSFCSKHPEHKYLLIMCIGEIILYHVENALVHALRTLFRPLAFRSTRFLTGKFPYRVFTALQADRHKACTRMRESMRFMLTSH